MRLFSELIAFLKDIYLKRDLIAELTRREYKNKYAGSYLGVAWLYLQPISYIAILWFVFSKGLRAGKVGNVPFILYMSTGVVCWQYFSENLNSSTNVIKQYSFLIKKINVRLSILPIVKVMSTLVPHLVLLGMIAIVSYFNDIYPTFYYLQVFYYMAAMQCLLVGLGWLTSSLNLFLNDVSKMISIFLQLGFFFTPIFWNVDRVSEQHQIVLMANPVYYIVSGYRDSLLHQVPFWDKPMWTLYFWGFTGIFLLLGAIAFARLRPHFAEVI